MEKEITKLSQIEIDDTIDKINNLLQKSSSEAQAYLATLSESTLLNVLPFVLPDYKVEAILALKTETALAVTESTDDSYRHYMHGMRGIQISEIAEELYHSNSAEGATKMPTFALQKILASGTSEAKNIVAKGITYLVENRQLSATRAVLIDLNPVDIAGILDDFDEQDVLRLFRLMPKDLASDVFIYLPSDVSEKLINLLSDVEVGHVINDMYADDVADFLEEMPSKVVKKVLAQVKPETRASINSLLQYAEDSAGSIMTVEYVDLKEDYTVRQAFKRIRRDGVDKETINNCFVIDSSRKLCGLVTLRKLLLAQPDEIVGDLMEENVIVIRTNTDQEEVANLFRKYGFTSMPVCDSENRLVGIVTVDDIVDIIQEEALEDASLISKVTPSSTEYLKSSVLSIFSNRIPWLLLLMVSATFTGLIISRFEGVLLVLSNALFAYIPMLMDSGGNSGNQASVTIIRGMALGEVEWKDYYKVVWKEFRVSLLLGLCMAVVCFAKIVLLDQFIFSADYFTIYNNGVVLYDGLVATMMVASIVAVSLFIAIVIAKIFGSSLPMIAKKLGLDPAVVASPIITTVVDALALLLYCYIALGLLT